VLLYRTVGSTDAWLGILAADCIGNKITSITGGNASATVTSCSVVWLAGASTDNLVGGILSEGFNAAGGNVVLADTASDNRIMADSFISGPNGTLLTNVVIDAGHTGTGNRIMDREGPLTTLTQNDATPEVGNALGEFFVTNNSNPTAYTNFTGGFFGQVVSIRVNDSNTSFVEGATLSLRPARDYAPVVGDTLTFRLSAGGVWRELSRAVNGGSFLTLARSVPVTETGATHTVGITTTHLICNRAGTVTVTLPAAADFDGREIYIRTITANTVVSASSNVVPRAGGAAGTAILAAAAGNWALLVSDGTDWQCMAGTA
jgi:hypothetical protein